MFITRVENYPSEIISAFLTSVKATIYLIISNLGLCIGHKRAAHISSQSKSFHVTEGEHVDKKKRKKGLPTKALGTDARIADREKQRKR